VKFAARSDKGIVREVNEDSFNIIEGYAGVPVTFIIADGMGGHNSGEVASKSAVDFASSYILEFKDTLFNVGRIPEDIQEIVKKANTNVFDKSRQHEANTGMGTTFIIAVIYEGEIHIGHVGDSRVYMIRNSEIKRITTDHSYIEELIKTGTLTREEAENHPNKNIITRALGCFDDIQVDLYTCEMMANDYYILCTDGLTNKLDENEIKQIVETNCEPENACEELIKKANEKGGEDNITVIVITND